jgi:integrase
MGLGPTHTISLAEARERARALRQRLLEGIDPLDERETRKKALAAERANAVTFETDAYAYFDLHENGWGPKHAQQWKTSVETYAFPKLGTMKVADITSADVLKAIEPLWIKKNVTAGRVLNRIEVVLSYATARGHRQGDNPASNVRATLPPASKVAAVENFAAVAYQEIGTVMARLREINTVPAIALRFSILCASRTGEILGCAWSEIDLANRTWKIPGERMKGGREHRVPLSAAAVELLGAVPKCDDEQVFPIDSHAMGQVLAKVSAGTTVHGMRSAFKTWATEQTAYPANLAEAALAHRLGSDKTEQAYLRGDLFQKRRKLMEAWGAFCTTKPAKGATGNVVAIAGARS